MADRQSRTSSAGVLCTYLVMGLLAIWPVLTVDIPPLVDFPNHLARMHVLATQGSSDIVQHNYDVAWRPVPNLAMDLIVPPLTTFFFSS